MENKENKIENFNTMAGGLYSFQRIYVELTDGVEPCCSGCTCTTVSSYERTEKLVKALHITEALERLADEDYDVTVSMRAMIQEIMDKIYN